MSVPGTSGDSLTAALVRAVPSLTSAHVPYAVIGACALAIWGQPRTTLDLDLLVLVSEKDLSALGTRLVRSGMKIDETWARWNPLLRGQQMRLHCRNVAVDLLRPRDRHDEATLRRRRRKRFAGRFYWFVAPEDFILQKLKVGRPRDFEDAVTVLARSGRALDRRHLRTWARRLGVWNELDYVERC